MKFQTFLNIKKVSEKLTKRMQVQKTDYGYLYDRVQVNSGKPQRYGTQGQCVGKNDWQPKPIENIELIDKLRAEMDMPSFKEYVEEVRKFCL